MKKIALLLFLGTIRFGFFAQNYLPFPTSSASWIDDEMNACSENHHWLDRDTIVNGLTYRKLFSVQSTTILHLIAVHIGLSLLLLQDIVGL